MKYKITKISRRTVDGIVIGKIVITADRILEVTLQFIDDVEGPTFRLNYHPKKWERAAILHVHLTPMSEAIPVSFRGSIDALIRSFIKNPKGCVQSLLRSAG